MDKPRILFYDIETSPLQSYHWQLGKQVLRHNQLVHGHSRWGIICITYCFNDGGKGQCLRFDRHGGTKGVVQKFDEIIKSCDHSIGKNSDRFDTKMINASRMFHGLPGIPEWTMYTDDLEKQMRKHFRLPSQSLDYISAELGLGGKIGMKFQDWVDISELHQIMKLREELATKELNFVSKHMFGEKASVIRSKGMEALNKMCEYGTKDVEDTRQLWYHLEEHFTPKFNHAKFLGEKIACINCGSTDIKKNGTRLSGKTKYQNFFCNSHGGYAGKAPIGADGKLGQIG